MFKYICGMSSVCGVIKRLVADRRSVLESNHVTCVTTGIAKSLKVTLRKVYLKRDMVIATSSSRVEYGYSFKCAKFVTTPQ